MKNPLVYMDSEESLTLEYAMSELIKIQKANGFQGTHRLRFNEALLAKLGRLAHANGRWV